MSKDDITYLKKRAGESETVDADVTFTQPVGFNGTAPVTKPIITGEWPAGSEVGKTLTAALEDLGLVTDSTTQGT